MTMSTSIVRTRFAVTIVLAIGVMSACAMPATRAAQTRAALAAQPPSDVVTTLVQLHGAVSEQYAAGGMELEHYLAVMTWIGDGIRIAQAHPAQWEGQARLKWPHVRSILATFEALQPWPAKIEALIQ